MAKKLIGSVKSLSRLASKGAKKLQNLVKNKYITKMHIIFII